MARCPCCVWAVQDAVQPLETVERQGHLRADDGRSGAATITRPMRRKRRIPPRRHRPEPPETGQDLSCTAANAKSLTGKALAPHFEQPFLRSQTLVFQKNPPPYTVCRVCEDDDQAGCAPA